MEAIWIITWLIFCIILGSIGSNRKIGFWGAFFLSLLLSPLIGLIITLTSKTKEAEKYENEILSIQRSQKQAIENLNSKSVGEIADDLLKIKNLLDNGVIDSKEYENLRNKLLTNFDSVEKANNSTTIAVDSNKTEIIVTPKYSENELGQDSSMFGGSQLKYEIDFKDGINGYLYKKINAENLFRIQCNKMSVYYSNKESAIDALYLYQKSGKISNIDRTYI